MTQMYDSVATLYKQGPRSYDQYGNEQVTYTEREVYVQPKSVYHAEFYAAAQAGLHPSVTLVISNREDYHGEKLVKFEGQKYDVIRVDWTAQRDAISLVLQERTDELN